MLFAAPIYLMCAGLVLVFSDVPEDFDPKEGWKLKAGMAPLLVTLAVGVLSLEGVSPALSFEREQSVTRSHLVRGSVADIKAKMAAPIVFDGGRPAFLSVFPLPRDIRAGSLETGDIHSFDFDYKRWFIGNTHEGRLDVELADVGERHVQTRITGNGAYFSHYLTVHGTRVDLTPHGDGLTEVSVRVDYRRDLDPAWYFGPLQKLAIRQSADHFIAEILTP